MKKQIFTFLTLFLVFSNLTYAGSESHGGIGVRTANKLYLLDLFESGLEDTAYFDPNVKPEIGLKERINNIFLDKPNFPSELLARKLAEISRINRVLAFALVRGMELYNWRFVNASLINTNDEDPTIAIDPKMRVQIALRKNSSISINKDAWAELDEKHKVALILHEIIYSFNAPRVYREVTSSRTREVVAYLMSKSMDSSNENALIGLSDVIKFDFSFDLALSMEAGHDGCKDSYFFTERNKGLTCGHPSVNLQLWFSANSYWEDSKRPISSYPNDHTPSYEHTIPYDFKNEESFLNESCQRLKKAYASLSKVEGSMIATVIFDPASISEYEIYRTDTGLKLHHFLGNGVYRDSKIYAVDNEIKCTSESIVPSNSRKSIKEYYENLISNRWN